jgi:hypothetical protein
VRLLRNSIRRQPFGVWFAGFAAIGVGLQWWMELKEKGYFAVVRAGGAEEANSGMLAIIIIGITVGFGILLLLYCALGWFFDKKR